MSFIKRCHYFRGICTNENDTILFALSVQDKANSPLFSKMEVCYSKGQNQLSLLKKVLMRGFSRHLRETKLHIKYYTMFNNNRISIVCTLWELTDFNFK